MPSYDYRCPHCGERTVLRRFISELDEPVFSLCCGSEMERLFTPTANIHIPVHFQAVREGGLEGGYSWSDFHDVSERELAHLRDEDGNKIEVEHAGVAISQSGGPSRAKKRRKSNATN